MSFYVDFVAASPEKAREEVYRQVRTNALPPDIGLIVGEVLARMTVEKGVWVRLNGHFGAADGGTATLSIQPVEIIT